MNVLTEYEYDWFGASSTYIGRENQFLGHKEKAIPLVKALHEYLAKAYQDPNNGLLDYYVFISREGSLVWKLNELMRKVSRKHGKEALCSSNKYGGPLIE